MKKLCKINQINITNVSSTLMFSCSDDDSTSSSISSIADVASRNSNLTILVEALQRTDLVEVLDSNGSYTVFAPTNQAFQNFLSENNFASLNDVPVDVLKRSVIKITLY